MSYIYVDYHAVDNLKNIINIKQKTSQLSHKSCESDVNGHLYVYWTNKLKFHNFKCQKV